MSNSIRIGLMAPLTGLVEIYGPEISWAAQIACNEINERGGIHGRMLELVIEDDGSLPETAVRAAKRLINEHGCVALIGNLLSNSRIAVVSHVAERMRIPLLNFSFYEGSISSRYFFHFAALPNQQIDKMIPFMARRFGHKMFFAGNNYEWPRGSIDAAKRILLGLGGETVGERYLPIGAPPAEIEELLDQVSRSGADVFVPYFAGSDQIILLTRFTQLGLKHRMAVVMGHYDEMMVSHLPPSVREGFYSSNTYFMSLDTLENRHYLQRLVHHPEVDGIWPNGNGILTNFGEGTYLCLHAFARAAERSLSTDAEALVDALENIQLKGPQGTVEMNPETHHASVNSYLAVCNPDGTFNIIERFGLIPPQIPQRYVEQMQSARLHESPASPEVTARLAAEIGAAKKKISTAQQILNVADMGILATDAHGVIIEANRIASLMFGYSENELVGLSVHLLLPPHLRQKHADLVERFVASDETERRMANRSEIAGYRKDGSFFPIEASIAKFKNEGEHVLVVAIRDITERKKAEEELTWRATHDPLTGLPNRALIRERLTSALLRSRRDGLSLALLFIDLDGFKLINDTHGHEAGDQLLKNVAARLIEQVRPGDTVARLAGDEFVIMCEQVEQPATLSVLAERINDTLRKAFEWNQAPLFVTASIGIAVGNGTSHSADDLLRFADTAMYSVKEKGRDGWQFFSESMNDLAQQRLNITNGLRLAIDRNELSTRFQPIVAADSGLIVGAELLLRWQPAEGEISPAVFIPVAEMTGIIIPIGSWVFRQACRAEVDWRLRWGASAPYVSFNVSARQLGETSLVDDFAVILRETGADPRHLLLEVTETSLMADVESNLRVLRRLANLGIRVAVDDFGTGYSSLAQLTRLPVNVLKIDRAFIDGLDKSEENRAVIRAITGLGRALSLKVIAEGVENGEQRAELSAYGCDYIQGYYFHRPLAEPAFIDLIEKESKSETAERASSLHFLIYVSEASEPITERALTDLIKKAQAFNRSVGITGRLIYKDGYFIQMLEGRRESLFALMDKIKGDSRHRNVDIIIEGPVRQRIFTEWGMLLNNLSEEVNTPLFKQAQRRSLTIRDLADDPYMCYVFLTGSSGIAL